MYELRGAGLTETFKEVWEEAAVIEGMRWEEAGRVVGWRQQKDFWARALEDSTWRSDSSIRSILGPRWSQGLGGKNTCA